MSSQQPGALFIIVGPSGSGKSSICQEIIDRDNCIQLSLSTTTRAPRGGETDGVEYNFLSREEFEAEVDAAGFLEWAEYVGNLYGTSKRVVGEALAAGKDVLFDIDLQGAEQLKVTEFDTTLIFVMPPNADELEARLRGRGTDADEAIAGRMQRASEEMQAASGFDYVVINDNLSEAIDAVHDIIKTQRHRAHRNLERVNNILRSFG